MADRSYQTSGILNDKPNVVPIPVPAQKARDLQTWHNCSDYAAAHALDNEFFQGKQVGQNISQQYDPDQLNESGRQLLDHVFILEFRKPRFLRVMDKDGIYEERCMGLAYYMLPYDSPLRLPLMEALLSSELLHTILVDTSLQPDDNGIATGVEYCEGLYESRSASLVEYLEDDWGMIHDDFPHSAAALLFEEIQKVKMSGCQAILDTRPTVFLTIANHYDHDVQKALLDLVNQLGELLKAEEEARIRLEDLQRKERTSILFSEYGCPEAEIDAHGELQSL
jgi:hypothetical protein